MKITMTVEVHYIPNGVSREKLQRYLEDAIECAYENGAMTQNTAAEVETYGVEFS
jgi:uncharacterized protein YqgV (UPF0045/DUF77 family)